MKKLCRERGSSSCVEDSIQPPCAVFLALFFNLKLFESESVNLSSSDKLLLSLHWSPSLLQMFRLEQHYSCNNPELSPKYLTFKKKKKKKLSRVVSTNLFLFFLAKSTASVHFIQDRMHKIKIQEMLCEIFLPFAWETVVFFHCCANRSFIIPTKNDISNTCLHQTE